MKTEDEVFEESLTTVFETQVPNNNLVVCSSKINLDSLRVEIPKSIVDDMAQWHPYVCGRCYADVPTMADLYPAQCQEKPELLLGQPIGMYHCPDCGAMVMAGVKHPSLCIQCVERKHPDFD